MNKGDYIVFEDTKKFALLQITGVNDDEVYGILEKNRAYDPVNHTVSKSDIVVNLGQRPPSGNVYGCLIEPYFRSETIDWGDLHWHIRPSKEERQSVKAELAKCLKILTRHKLMSFLPISIEVRLPKGRHAGSYKCVYDEDKTDVMVIRPKEGLDLRHVVLHESGHAVWNRILKSAKGKSKWIQAYHKHVQLAEIDSKIVIRLLKDLTESQERISDFRGQQEEDDAIVLDTIIDYIADYHSLTLKDLNTLTEAGESLAPYWPKHKLEISDLVPEVTEYSVKNVEEYFCECFALHLAGKKLPKAVTLLLDKTLTSLRGK